MNNEICNFSFKVSKDKKSFEMIRLLPNVAEKVGLPIKVDETGQPNKI